MLRCWGIDAQVSIRAAGEIDVAFAIGIQRYVLEAKWERSKADTGDLAKLQRRVGQRFQGTVGLFVAMAGYSPDALNEVDRGGRLEVLLLDRQHFEAMLSGFAPPHELLKLIHDRAAFRGEAFTPLLTLMTKEGAPPVEILDAASELEEGAVLNAHTGMSCTTLVTLPDSNQFGIAIRDNEGLLVTTQHGIIDVDLIKRRTSWAVPIRDCHRNGVVQADGAIVFARRHGVGRFQAGELSIVGGGFAGATCLTRKHDDSVWVLSNGDLTGTSGPSITKLGANLGDETRHALAYPPASASNAVWIDDSHVVVTGNPGFLITNVANAATRIVGSARSNPMGLAYIGDNIVLTAADSVSLGITDLATGSYAEVMRLALRPSVNEIAAIGRNGVFYLASYYGGEHMRIAILAFTIPMPISAFTASALSEAKRGDLSGFAAEVERIRAANSSASTQEETERQRLERLYNEALRRVHTGIFQPLQIAIESSGLRPGAFEERPIQGWPPTDFGGSASLPRWGIESLRSPSIAASIGVVHRAQPAEDLNDLAVTVVLARLTADGQHNHLEPVGKGCGGVLI